MKFSIITITYNRGHLISETIQSVLNQTYQNFEYIIVDDGSTDNTEDIIKQFNDKRIHYFKHEKIGRLSTLRNLGFKEAKGDIISIIDSDDLWNNNKLEKTLNVFDSKQSIEIAINNLSYFNDAEILETSFYNYSNDFHKNLLLDILENKILSFSVYSFRKSLLDHIGFFDETKMDGQHNFYLRAAAYCDFYFISEVLSLIRLHNQNSSQKENIEHYKDALTSYKNLFDSEKISNKSYNKVLSLTHYKMARYFQSQQQIEEAKENFKSTMKRTHIFNSLFIKSFLFKTQLFLISKN